MADDDFTTNHLVVPHEEWLAARRELLEREKAFTRHCDEMSRLQPAMGTRREELRLRRGQRLRDAHRSVRRTQSTDRSCFIPTTGQAVLTVRCAPTGSRALAST